MLDVNKVDLFSQPCSVFICCFVVCHSNFIVLLIFDYKFLMILKFINEQNENVSCFFRTHWGDVQWHLPKRLYPNRHALQTSHVWLDTLVMRLFDFWDGGGGDAPKTLWKAALYSCRDEIKRLEHINLCLYMSFFL